MQSLASDKAELQAKYEQKVGPGAAGLCSARHRMPFDSSFESANCVGRRGEQYLPGSCKRAARSARSRVRPGAGIKRSWTSGIKWSRRQYQLTILSGIAFGDLTAVYKAPVCIGHIECIEYRTRPWPETCFASCSHAAAAAVAAAGRSPRASPTRGPSAGDTAAAAAAAARPAPGVP